VGVVDQNHRRQTADLHGQQSKQRHERRDYQLPNSITGGDLMCFLRNPWFSSTLIRFINK